MFFFSWLLLSVSLGVSAYCPNDDDLQRHRCTCSLANSYIQCSSLPAQCRTCYQYERLFFDEQVQFLPAEAFRGYDLFRSSDTKRSFTIQFARLDRLSSNSFSKIDIEQNQTLEIKVSKYNSALLPTRLFEDVTLQAKGTLDVEIFNVTSKLFTIEQYVFDGMKFAYQSQFRLAILSAKETIEFQSNAGSILLPSYATMELYFSNFHRVIFDEHSFDHITQEHFSQLRLNFDRFDEARLEHRSFIDLHQLDQSEFHLGMANFHRLTIEQTLFETITQLKSSLVFSISNLTSDLCLPGRMFSQIQQDMNSTFQFQVQYAGNILFQSETVMNVSQRAQSSLSLVMINTLDVYFAEQSISNFHQEDRSLLDIWVKSGRNLIFEDYAIENVDIWRSSLMRVGFQYSSGTLQMATNAFMNINEGQGGELLFQLINATDFYFRFNQSFQLQRLEIVDRLFTEEADLCRLIEIPSHLPVKLLSAQPCSCPVFYLYRRLRHTFKPSLLKDLVPACYSNLSLDRLEYEEKQCSFAEHTRHCQQMQGHVTIELPIGLCHQPLIHEKSVHSRGSYSSSVGVLGSLIGLLALIYFLSTEKRRLWLWSVVQRSPFRSRRQKLTVFAGDSYQQLTSDTPTEDQLHLRPSSSRMMKIIVRYNSTTERSQPHLHSSDFVVDNDRQPDEDHTLKLNTNPLSDIQIDS